MLWGTEIYNNTSLSMKVREVLYQCKSQYQMIEIFDTYDYGKVLMLDGCMMVSEADEFFYHETISHLPISLLKKAQNVLVLGGGDGGTVREVARYDQVKNIDLVEIDGDVINACKKYLPTVSVGFNNPKVNTYVQDANVFLETVKDKTYDLVICDGSDPVGFAEVLIQRNFYQLIQRVLGDNGIFITQTGSPLSQKEELQSTWTNLSSVFPHCKIAWSVVPIYPGAFWSFMIASNEELPTQAMNPEPLPEGLSFWCREYLASTLTTPNFVREIIEL